MHVHAAKTGWKWLEWMAFLPVSIFFCCVLALSDRCPDFSSKRKRCDGKTPPNAWKLCHGGTACLHPSRRDAGGTRVHCFNSQNCTNVISRAQWGSDNSVPSMLTFLRWLNWQIGQLLWCLSHTRNWGATGVGKLEVRGGLGMSQHVVCAGGSSSCNSCPSHHSHL